MARYRGKSYPFIDGFWSRVPVHEDGCWEWQGARDRKGYGKWGVPVRLAHRAMYEWAHGPIPEGSVVMHSCDNPACVRPSHLMVGSVADNQADMASKGRGYWGARDRCTNGHLFSEHGKVIFKRKTGSDERYRMRLCLLCKADEQRRRRARH